MRGRVEVSGEGGPPRCAPGRAVGEATARTATGPVATRSRRWPWIVAIAALAGGGLSGCDRGAEQGREAVPPDASSAVPETQGEAAADRPEGEATSAPGAAVPPGVLIGPTDTLPGAGPWRTYSLLLVNDRPATAVILASAGAARVVLDTLAPSDSTRVNVQVRARAVRLEATDLAGRILQTAAVAPHPDSLTRWVVRSGGAPDRL